MKKQPIRKGVKNTRTGTLDELNRRDLLSDLINGESNGLHVLSFSPLLPAVLLHQRHQEAAIWLAGRIRVFQGHLELRVDPECGCSLWEKTGRWGFVGFAATDPPFPVPCTWEVPASAGRASSPPLALIERRTPLLHLTRLERVCRQVTDLQPSELTQEITERHPERERDPVTPWAVLANYKVAKVFWTVCRSFIGRCYGVLSDC